MESKLNIAKLWKSYNNTVLPVDAPEVQRQECQLAFYAGCHATLCLLVAVTEKTTEQQGSNFIAGLIEEINQFSKKRAG